MQVSAFIIYLLFHWRCTEGYPINSDGTGLIENDIVGPHSPNVFGSASGIGAALVGNSKWLDKTVPYEFSYQFDVAMQNKVFNAMKEIQDKTCIHFRRKKNVDRNYVHFMQDANKQCYSNIGMIGRGSQNVSLPNWCVNDHDSVLHELLHVLGIVHEQNRHDRDDYITIHWDNLGVSREDINWKKYSREQLLYYQTEYDFHSVMHYPGIIMVEQGSVTAITPISPGVTIESNGLSKNDIRRLKKHYECLITDGNDNDSADNDNDNDNGNDNDNDYGDICQAHTCNHKEAVSILRKNDIPISSTGSCSNKNNPDCTSLDGIKQKAIRDVITLKTASGCLITVTGGTETGRATGDHSQGWELDVRMNGCLRNYVRRNFRSVGNGFYCAPSGNRYYDGRNHIGIHYGKTSC